MKINVKQKLIINEIGQQAKKLNDEISKLISFWNPKRGWYDKWRMFTSCCVPEYAEILQDKQRLPLVINEIVELCKKSNENFDDFENSLGKKLLSIKELIKNRKLGTQLKCEMFIDGVKTQLANLKIDSERIVEKQQDKITHQIMIYQNSKNYEYVIGSLNNKLAEPIAVSDYVYFNKVIPFLKQLSGLEDVRYVYNLRTSQIKELFKYLKEQKAVEITLIDEHSGKKPSQNLNI